MARIRTIKPGFFRHEELFEAERETGLPLRLAFAGLWTACDREGRFKWSPRQLKLDCLPFDDVDFSRVLDALATRGQIVKYVVDGVEYGYIPTWHRHQIINNREAKSEIPEPSENNKLTRDPRVDDACVTPLIPAQGERKGKEQEGKEISALADAARTKSVEKKSRKGNATPLPDPYPIQPQISEYAQQRGFTSSELVREHERFCNHAKQNDRRCVDWIAAERNWLITAAERAGKPMQAGQAADDGLIEVIDDEALTAWDNYRRAKEGRTFPRNARGGWRFPSKYPPGYEPRKGEASPPVIPQLPRMSARP